MSSNKKVKTVGGTSIFQKFFTHLLEDDPLKQEIRDAMQLLLEDCTRGNKIQHRLWPSEYKILGINNLWRFELTGARRLIYTIIGEPDGLIVSIIEVMSHKEYEGRFDY